MRAGGAADYLHMATFWFWGIRNPLLAFCALSIASGFAAVLEWSPALALALPCALIAEAADWLGGRAADWAEERARAEAAARSKLVPFTPYLDEQRRRNAA